MFHGSAHVYDAIYTALGKNYATESQTIHELIQQRCPQARTLLDVACGTGGHLQYLQRHYDVTGVDLDPAMLKQARARLPSTDLIEADMRSLRLNRTFDAVICLFSGIGYMAATSELNAAVAAMASHLTPHGVLIVDSWVLPGEWRGTVGTDLNTAVTDTLKVARVVHATRQGRTTRLQMHHLVATDRGVDYIVDHHELTLFSRREYQAALQLAGLNVETIDSPLPGRDRYIGQPTGAS